jgi:2-polyprenyl-6-methoxyphenol hydroxylase-like FAD-dependent oxidoreductase
LGDIFSLLERFNCVEVNLGHAVESIIQDQKSVTITVKDTQSDRTYRVQAKYVLGCDGGRSITRQQAGIELHDYGFHQRQLVVDTLLTAKVDLPSKVQQLCDTRRPGVFVHSTNNHRRWEFVLAQNETQEEMERPAKVRELLSNYWIDPDQLNIIRAVVYHFHSLIALQWRNDRIFIVGDAAHQMPPILGQGMCSGIRDAQNLGWKLDLVLRGLAPDRLLDSYQSERLPHVREIIKLATRAFKIFKTRNRLVALVRNMVMRLIQRFTAKTKFQNVGSDMPPLRHGILANSVEDKQSVAGQMFIQPQVLNNTGQLVLLDHILGNSFAILGINADWLDFITPESQAFLLGLSTKFIYVVPDSSVPCPTKFADELELVEDTSNQITDWLTKQQKEIVIIRPDRYVFGTCDRQQLNTTVKQLQSCLIVYTRDGNDSIITYNPGVDNDEGLKVDIWIGDSEVPLLDDQQPVFFRDWQNRFILGDWQQPYYVDSQPSNFGLNEFAAIVDLDPNRDIIQLHGSPEDYLLEEAIFGDNELGTAIFWQNGTSSDLVAFLPQVFDLNLGDDLFQFEGDTPPPVSFLEEAQQSGTTGIELSTSSATDLLGNIYVAGATTGSVEEDNAGAYDPIVTKYDSDGNQIWNIQFGSANFDWITDIVTDNQANFYVAGYTEGDLGATKNAEVADVWVAKYDSDGNQIWIEQFGTELINRTFGIDVDNEGDVYLSGYTIEESINSQTDDSWVTKYDSDGSREWFTQFGTTQYDEAYDVAVDNQGNAYSTGWTVGDLGANNSGIYDVWVAKHNNDGELQFIEQFGSEDYEFPWGIDTDTEGNVY